jgi:transcriptional regulator with XRE-family HTH domain
MFDSALLFVRSERVSASLDFLHEYLKREDITQAAFADACGMAPSNLSAILNRDIAIGSDNIPRLMRGVRGHEAKLRLLATYLRDQVPREFSNEIAVHLGASGESASGLVMETTDSHSQTSALASAFRELPSEKLQDAVLSFVQQLRDDGELRDVFLRMTAYLNRPLSPAPAPAERKSRGKAKRSS